MTDDERTRRLNAMILGINKIEIMTAQAMADATGRWPPLHEYFRADARRVAWEQYHHDFVKSVKSIAPCRERMNGR